MYVIEEKFTYFSISF